MKAASTPFKKKKKQSGVWLTLLPLYLFTLVFVAGPLVYMFVLSFQTRAEVWGVVNQFTLDNYKNIFQPVYLNTFVESFKLALTSTLLICAIGYPFGYFMAKLSEGKKKLAMLFLMLPFWVNSLIRLYGWIIILQKKGLLNYILMKLGLIQEPLKILYSYPAIVIGMVYVLLPFMALSVYSSAEKLDWSLIEAARDLGANSVQTFTKILLPLSVPGIISGITMVFVPSLTTFVISDLLGGSKILLIGNVIEQEFKQGSNWHSGSGMSLVLMIFILISMALIAKYDKDGEGTTF